LGKTLGLISCTKSKRNYSCPAKEMYSASELFRKAYDNCIKNYDHVAILSAKYGLLLPDEPSNREMEVQAGIPRTTFSLKGQSLSLAAKMGVMGELLVVNVTGTNEWRALGGLGPK